MQPKFTREASNFLAEHTLATISTVSDSGKVHGAVVYYVSQGDQNVFFISKSDTSKVKNIEQHPQVALTIFNAAKAQTLQISGNAKKETDASTVQFVIDSVIKPRPYDGQLLMPPVTALDPGEYVVIRIQPEEVRFSDYKQELIEKRTA